MKLWKWTGLVLSGGVLLQLGGCWSVLADVAMNAVLSGATSQLLSGLSATPA